MSRKTSNDPQKYDYFYDPRRAELGDYPVNNAPIPPDRTRTRPPGSRKTLGQVAMEADAQNVRDDPRMARIRTLNPVHIPTWEQLPAFQKQNWEKLALRVALALAREFPDELEEMKRGVVEMEGVNAKPAKAVTLTLHAP